MAGDFFARVPARLLKDFGLSPRARFLWVVLSVYADGRTHRTFVGTRTLEQALGCGRIARQTAERELVQAGWLAIEQEREARGYFARRWYQLLTPKSAAVRKLDAGGRV